MIPCWLLLILLSEHDSRQRRGCHYAPISRARPSLFAGDRGWSAPEMTADRAFTSFVVLACCTLGWLEGCSSAARAQPCGSKPRGHKVLKRAVTPLAPLDLGGGLEDCCCPVLFLDGICIQ